MRFYIFMTLMALSLQCCAITEQHGEPLLSRLEAERLADSIFRSMDTDERIMQLYIYAPKTSDNYIVQSGPVPGGVMLPVSTIATMKKQIDALGSWGDAPGLIALDFNRPIPATPNYINPYNIPASHRDSVVMNIVTNSLTDTLLSIGFNYTAGLIADGYGSRASAPHSRRIAPLIGGDTTAHNAFILTMYTSVKAAIESNNEFITGTTTPEMFLIRAQKAVKDHPELLQIIDRKANQILRLKISLKTYRQKPQLDITKAEASAICAMKSISCVKNDNQLLPMPSGSNIDIIQIGGFKMAGFYTQAGFYGDYNYNYADTATASVITALAKRHEGRKCVILLNATIDKPATAQAISRAANDENTCIVNFDNPKNIALIDGKCIVQQIGNNATAAKMAARAVFGEIDIDGEFPYQEPANTKSLHIAANKLKYTILRETGFNLAYKDTLDSVVSAAIREGAFPGCQVFAAKDGKILINKAYGHFTYDSLTRPVNTTDLYDLASLTKVTAATLLAMKLYDTKKMDIEKPLGTYLHYDDSLPKPIMNVKIKSLLQHRSGIYAYPPIIRFGNNSNGWRRLGKSIGLDTDSLSLNQLADAAYKELYSPIFDKDGATTRIADSLWLRDQYVDSIKKFFMHLSVKRRNRYQYSDVNMILLQWAAEEVLKCRADSFLSKNFYQPLGMTRTCHTPLSHNIPADQIAPTEAQPWTGKMLQGDVHDPAAALLGGISGNAGLFSTAYNIGILFQMLLDGGQYGGKRYFNQKTVEKFTTKQPNTKRALGFDMAPNNFVAEAASKRTYGHTGFTGTCAWADPDNKIVVVFTCNRIHPDANNKKINELKLRQKISQVIYDGCGIFVEEDDK